MSKIKPILFSTPMVQAILDGTKTQTRRIVKPQPFEFMNDPGLRDYPIPLMRPKDGLSESIEPKYYKGDILWVREAFEKVKIYNDEPVFIYKANWITNFSGGWKPSIHMPKEAARIFLEVTNVRIERLQDISESDAIAEGIKYNETVAGYSDYINTHLSEYFQCLSPQKSFMTLWQAINGADSWKDNPWVWVYEFKTVERPYNFNN